MKLENSVYDFLKVIALVWLPAISTLYFALAGIWNLPDAEQVVGSITAVDAFLGAALHLSSKSYTPPPPESDGSLVIDKSQPDKNLYTLEIDRPVSEIEAKGHMVLKAVYAGSGDAK